VNANKDFRNKDFTNTANTENANKDFRNKDFISTAYTENAITGKLLTNVRSETFKCWCLQMGKKK
jgi:hypothetical protein